MKLACFAYKNRRAMQIRAKKFRCPNTFWRRLPSPPHKVSFVHWLCLIAALSMKPLPGRFTIEGVYNTTKNSWIFWQGVDRCFPGFWIFSLSRNVNRGRFGPSDGKQTTPVVASRDEGRMSCWLRSLSLSTATRNGFGKSILIFASHNQSADRQLWGQLLAIFKGSTFSI